MLSKCANPTCSATFRYLRIGKLFELEVDVRRPDSPDSPTQKIEYFWLCEECAKTLEVVACDGKVRVQRRREETPQDKPKLKNRRTRARGAG